MAEMRDYQASAVRAAFAYWSKGRGQAPVIVAPTGSGKSHIIGGMIQRIRGKNPKAGIVLLTHREELIVQDAQKILQHDAQADPKIFSASLGKKDLGTITCAQVQSFARLPAEKVPEFALAIIDEAHLVPPEGRGQYQTVIEKLKSRNRNIRLLGLTATPFRMKQGMLWSGEGALFDGRCYEIEIGELIARGFLVAPRTADAEEVLDLGELRVSQGDYVIRDQDTQTLAKADKIAGEICRTGAERKKWLVFCAGVSGAESMATAIQKLGVKAHCVTGETVERVELLDAFRHGDLRCLTSCDVLTTGFDAPVVDMLVLLRATKSPGLYVQMVGRGLRVAEGKSDCLVLDYGGNVDRHGPIDAVKAPAPKDKGEGEPPTKACPMCKAINYAMQLRCYVCGYAWPDPREDLSDAPTSRNIFGNWHDVLSVKYQRWRKPDSIRVMYRYADGGKTGTVSEWYCPDHSVMAAEYWRRRKRLLGAKANTVNEAEGEWHKWRKPIEICVGKEPGGTIRKRPFQRVFDLRFDDGPAKQVQAKVRPQGSVDSERPTGRAETRDKESPLKVRTNLARGARNRLDYSPPTSALKILHKDNHLLLIDKPTGLLTVPGRDPRLSDCLHSRVRKKFPEALLVHRLDLGTSGIIVFARTRSAQRNLSIQFQKRLVDKFYVAIVYGLIRDNHGVIDLPLSPDWDRRPRNKVDLESGRPAETRWFAMARKANSTRVCLVPKTGRSHQLRVHMLSTGHPILGDQLYADGKALEAADRLMLHAQSLSFRHPDGGKLVTYGSPCPF